MVSFLLLWVLEAIPAAAVLPGVVAAIVTFTGAETLQGRVLNALVVAAAPTALRGRYLAVYQLSRAFGRAAAPGALSWLLALGSGWPWAGLAATCSACALLPGGARRAIGAANRTEAAARAGQLRLIP